VSKKKSKPAERATTRPPFDPDTFAKESDLALTRRHDLDSDLPTAPGERVESVLAKLAAAAAAGATELRITGIPSAEAGVTLDRIPYLVMSPEDLEWFGLDEAAMKLIGKIDGQATVQQLVASGDFSVSSAFAILGQLSEQGIVAFR
jgi:hypothetical protein